MAVRRYEISLRMVKNIPWVLNQNIHLTQETIFTMNGALQKNSNLNSAHP